MRQRNISRMINTTGVAAAAVVVFHIIRPIKWRFAGALSKLSGDYLMIRLARRRHLICRRNVNSVRSSFFSVRLLFSKHRRGHLSARSILKNGLAVCPL